ncbi:MAG: DUF1592 domain-containing protein [Planctomycetota bacterium]
MSFPPNTSISSILLATAQPAHGRAALEGNVLTGVLPPRRWLILLASLWINATMAAYLPGQITTDVEDFQMPLVKKYCVHCHSGNEADGSLDLDALQLSLQTEQHRSTESPSAPEPFAKHFEQLRRVAELLADGSMPPEDEEQPSEAELLQFEKWFEDNYLSRIDARPGRFRPRRLATHEYRNTLQSMMGFKLEVAIIEAEQTLTEKSLVMKLLPTDPPGPSGFTNDTSRNLFSRYLWEQYSLIADSALDRLLGEHQDKLPFSLDDQSNPQAWIDYLLQFRHRAYRRVLAPSADSNYADYLGQQFKESENFRAVLRTEMKVVLMSPSFLHRGLMMPTAKEDSEDSNDEPSQFLAVDSFELAERLSYFLWADMPDNELLRAAESGELLKSSTMQAQVTRMLNSSKARSLAEDFATQWFSLKEIEKVNNNPPVMLALKSQPIDFLNYLFQEDRPLLELIDSDVSFINQHTAKYYRDERQQLEKYRKQKGIEVEALPNQKIQLTGTPERGGLLTMPGVLAMNRGPILRGTWLLERVLGEHLPDPPANVPPVPGNPPGKKLSFRERFELHRSQTSCAVCHDKIDPLGFSLEAYDNAGGFKPSANYQPTKADRKAGVVIDKNPLTTGRLPSGEEFQDFAELKEILVQHKRREIVENITRRTMEYALCRKLEYYDRPTVDRIADELLKQDGGSFHQLIRLITQCLPFTHTQVSE